MKTSFAIVLLCSAAALILACKDSEAATGTSVNTSTKREFALPPHFDARDSMETATDKKQSTGVSTHALDKQLNQLDQKQLKTVVTLLLETLMVLADGKQPQVLKRRLSDSQSSMRLLRSSKRRRVRGDKSNKMGDLMELLLGAPELENLASSLQCKTFSEHESSDASSEASSSSSSSSSSDDSGLVKVASLVTKVMGLATGKTAMVPVALRAIDEIAGLLGLQ